MDFKGWSLLFDLSPIIRKPETSLLQESTHTSQHTQKIKEQLIYQLQKRAIHHYLHNTFHFQLLTSFLTLDVPTGSPQKPILRIKICSSLNSGLPGLFSTSNASL